MRSEDCVAMILDKKKAVIRITPVHVGEFVFDYQGDLIGFYAGNGEITLCSDLAEYNKKEEK